MRVRHSQRPHSPRDKYLPRCPRTRDNKNPASAIISNEDGVLGNRDASGNAVNKDYAIAPIANLDNAVQVTCYHSVVDCQSLPQAQQDSLDKCMFITHCPTYGADLAATSGVTGFINCEAVYANGTTNSGASGQTWPALLTRCCDTTGITV